MKLSIIIPTLGRRKELSDLLESIYNATINFSYEVLIIDQNFKGFLDDIISQFEKRLPVLHFNVNFKGLSMAKNFGVKHARGEYICFPDDDAKVFKNTFAEAFNLLEKMGVDIICGRCVDHTGNDSVVKFRKTPYFLNKKNLSGGFVEATMFTKKDVFTDFLFDENMGVGTLFGAEEGYDWLYRILSQSMYKAYYSPEIIFYHPNVLLLKGDLPSLLRVYKYRCGTGHLCRKHKFYYKYYKRLLLCRLACAVFFIFDKKFYRYYKMEILGLRVGWNLYSTK